MSDDLNEQRSKRTITIEDIGDGVRVTVVGPSYLVGTGAEGTRDLATDDIGEVWLSNFAPGPGEDRATYSNKHCTDSGNLHSRSNECDGVCHDPNCSEPADFFQNWSVDGKERCIPLCKRHGRDMTHYVGRAVLWALDYAVVEDLRFWTQQDPLPGGLPRCDYRFHAIDSDGDSEKARCTNPATTRVRVTRTGPAGKVFEAKLCDDCAETESKRPDAIDDELGFTRHKVEVVSRLEGPGQ